MANTPEARLFRIKTDWAQFRQAIPAQIAEVQRMACEWMAEHQQ